ncbi:MAG: hypothetical protein JW840_00195 [Candidatus Thermoplasmatota archaeon]|nr:hypothetical protein [Candidatus Thermoplasmatota archaeon]
MLLGARVTCPFFVDLTRECIKKYKEFARYQSYDLCDTDNFSQCLLYTVCTADFNCKYLDRCSKIFHDNAPQLIQKIFSEDKVYKFLVSTTTTYCLSQSNAKHCARYKRFELGETPSYKLFPDGQRHILDFIVSAKSH